MKKGLLTLILLGFVKLFAFGQDTIYSIAYNFPQPNSNFEDRDTSNYFYVDTNQLNNIWQIGNPSKSFFDIAYSAPLALLTDTINTYPVNNVSSFELVIRSDDATHISFWHKINSDTLADGGIVEISSDGGVTWTNIVNAPQFTLENFYESSSIISSNSNKPGFSGTKEWTKSQILGYALNYVRFRFTFSSDNIETNKDGWMFDDFEFNCLGTGIESTVLSNKIRVFPNPNSTYLNIETENETIISRIKVFDLNGSLLFTTENSSILTSSLNNGMYILEVETNQGIVRRKIIKNAP
ncbi:MAG: T9SS type A sorting domain-containing protein [Bacteroidetes bacterium]|nr:T9SS type A sorting domain-containing protein [Bacteroidota bacterium]MBA3987490.1 T9SS type A sorting domain-containing protein [Flavobacteriales bacterium]MDQ3192289.1 T9SS type A sorting domain-containing protein [Bacteroidota bacterium]HET6243577.1 T9SS type A sorting domain-containing protein [Bacteroidia bacterium]